VKTGTSMTAILVTELMMDEQDVDNEQNNQSFQCEVNDTYDAVSELSEQYRATVDKVRKVVKMFRK
jgi:hypothetical protein